MNKLLPRSIPRLCAMLCFTFALAALTATSAMANNTGNMPDIVNTVRSTENDRVLPDGTTVTVPANAQIHSGGNYTVNSGHTLSLNNSALTVEGTGILNNSSGGAITMTGDSSLQFFGTSNVTNSGTITINDSSVLQFLGFGMSRTLGGTINNNNATGTSTSSGIVVQGNTLTITGAYTGTGNIFLWGPESHLVFNSATANTVAGVIAGPGSLTTSGSGTLTLTGNNTYTGSTTVGAGGTLILSGTGNIASSVLNLYGGSTFNRGAASLANLNTLNVRGTSTWTGNLNMANQTMNFFLPSTLADGDTMLAVSGTANVTNATVNVGISGGSSPLQAGNQVILIDAGTLTGAPANTTSSGQGMQGVTLKYEFNIAADTTAGLLTATVTSAGATVDDQSKALSEGFVGGAALVAQGGDMVAGQGMSNAVKATKVAGTGGAAQDAGTGATLAGFGALSAGSMRLKSGSHVDMNSVSLLAGLAWGQSFTPGRLTLGGFFEWGTGSYDTYNSFTNAASVRGKGDTHYYGAGILGRMDYSNTGPGRFYTEGSFRAGRIHNEYKNSDLVDSQGIRATYDSSSAYYGFHLSTGYIWNINPQASLDTYGKYFWTRVEGDSVTLSTGDPIKFRDADSSRIRLGSRFSYAVNEFVSPYIGAAFEREFDGKTRASTNGFAIPAPSIRGNTGIGELGFTLTPSQGLPLSLDFGVQGYVGKREGVTGSLQLRWEF